MAKSLFMLKRFFHDELNTKTDTKVISRFRISNSTNTLKEAIAYFNHQFKCNSKER